MKYISWFSCGAASATATKLALAEYGKENVRVIYQQTNSEHPDNERFFLDCQEWFGVEIEVHQSEKYKNIWDVFEKTRYLVGVGGARCTGELKKKVANKAINWGKDQEFEIFGYTYEEKKRVERFIENNNERKIIPILLNKFMTKDDCLGFIDRAGIELPEMYKLGYKNNNCIGCVKGQAGYWNKIKVDFPEVFEQMSKVERELNVAINKKYVKGERIRIFLDELPEDMGEHLTEPSIQCGLLCAAEHDDLDNS